MSITTISDNERRLIGEAQVLRALLAEAADVISICAGDDDTEAELLDRLETKIRAALRQPAEFMPSMNDMTDSIGRTLQAREGAAVPLGQKHAELPAKFQLGDGVRKIKGAQWSGLVVGTYSTTLTPEGYAVESTSEVGSVQIYPAAALREAAEVMQNQPLAPAVPAQAAINIVAALEPK